MEPELVRNEEGLVIGIITRMTDDRYEASLQPKRGHTPANGKTREFDRLEDACRWIEASTDLDPMNQ